MCRSRSVEGQRDCFDGFTGFTPVQNRVIAELMKQAKEVIVTVTPRKRGKSMGGNPGAGAFFP